MRLGVNLYFTLLHLFNSFLDLFRSSCIQFFFIWRQFPEKTKKLSDVNEFFIGDVFQDRDGEFIVC